MKKYYDKKRLEGLDLKKGDKVWLLYKDFKNRRSSKKLDYIKLRPFRIVIKILKVIYKLDLPVKMKIYLVQYIIMLELAKGDVKPLLYEMDIYRGQEEDEWDVQKVIGYKDINEQKWYKVKWTGYNETTWELKENLKNMKKKVKEYYKKASQVKEERIN